MEVKCQNNRYLKFLEIQNELTDIRNILQNTFKRLICEILTVWIFTVALNKASLLLSVTVLGNKKSFKETMKKLFILL